MNEDSWNRKEIIKKVENYMYLYLFKGNVSKTKIAIRKLFNLNDNELESLITVHFLLSNQLNEFIQILPYLLKNLQHSTLREKEEYKGLIKGRVDWNQTLKETDPTLFICTPLQKSYDLEINQLLKFLLEKIIYLYENRLKIDEDTKGWHEVIRNNYYKAQIAIKNVYFKNIKSINKVPQKTLNKRYRNQNYLKVINLYRLYEKLFIMNDLDTLKELLKNQLLKPADDDTIYELYVFFKLVSKLKDPELGLLMEGNDYSAISKDNIKIYYQNTPKIFNSKYKDIIANYNIQATKRRPDIIIEFSDYSYRIVEVKRTSDEGYLRNSVYKVLAYLEDFKEVNYTDQIPGVIVCWSGIAITNEDAFKEDILILNKDDFIASLDLLLK